ncbi:MAG: MBL fold metallo-hydrolase [Acidimicrobiia bacterium]|nr:MBL fold metallo-hydrolase [Acidimicrobiia bacterium]MDH3397107.1 MBL fold metallo-hydrolase [Acidimicrobiia bacterium]MDH5615186.1 MBL fold metallo-hydrolase [Acidimicrobiia bacterium]
MLIAGKSLWLAETNCWVVAPDAGGLGVLIDAPPDPGGVIDLLAEHHVTPVALLLTHGHIDHTGGAGVVVGSEGIDAYVHPDDDYLTLDPLGQLRTLFGMVPPGDFSPPARRIALSDGQILRLAGFDLQVVHTPGHTPGHCCFLIRDEGILFSGDHLFAGSIGRTDLPGGDYDTLMDSMRDKVLPLDDQVLVYPGHGPTTTLARERRTNPFLQELI